MAGEAQRHCIAEAARDRCVVRSQAAGRLGETDLVAGEQGTFGGVGDFEIVMPGHRANANGDRPLERLRRRLAFLQSHLRFCLLFIPADIGFMICSPTPGLKMSEPESHILRLLREFRQEFSAYRKDFDRFRDKEFHEFREETNARFDELTRLFAGESILGRYAAAEVEARLASLEKRLSTLEGRR
jgi:hypothetical protein